MEISPSPRAQGVWQECFLQSPQTCADRVGGLDVLIIEKRPDTAQGYKIYLPRSLRGVAGNIEKYLAENISILSNNTFIGFAATPEDAGWKISAYIAYRLRRGRDILIVVDDVKADTPSNLSDLRQWLESFANSIAEYNRDYYFGKGGTIAVVALTSDATVSEILDVVGDKVSWAVMWNFTREASEKIIERMGIQHRVAEELGVSGEKALEILWRLVGGNPGALELIWEKGLGNGLGRGS